MAIDTAQHPDTRTSFFPRIADSVRQFFCGLHGHDDLLHFGEGKLSLHCVSCGYESPGWEVERGTKLVRTAAPAPRARVVRMPRPDERRVA